MEHSAEKFVTTFDKSEVSKCMICLDPPCTKACPQHADVGNILKSLYFRNYIGAVDKLSCDCTYCNAPCEKACVLKERSLPVEIHEVLMQVKKNAGLLPVSRIEQVDLSTDICGVKLENPFLLSSSVVASSYDMCKRDVLLRPDGQELHSRPSAAFLSTRPLRGSQLSGITPTLSADSRTSSSSLTTVLKRTCIFSKS